MFHLKRSILREPIILKVQNLLCYPSSRPPLSLPLFLPPLPLLYYSPSFSLSLPLPPSLMHVSTMHVYKIAAAFN